MAKKYFIDKALWVFTGEDSYVLSQCEEDTQQRFTYIGTLVIVILMLSSISIFYGVNELLDSLIFDFVISIYVVVFFLFLFMLILYTLNKNVLPSISSTENKVSRWVSNFIRIAFLAVLAFLVSQPIEYALFSTQVSTEFNQHITQLLENRNVQLNQEFRYKLDELIINNKPNNTIKKELKQFNEQKKIKLKQYESYLKSKNFFMYKMGLIDTHLWYAWICTGLFILLFILPFYLKYKIPIYSNYYVLKRNIQKNIILEHHQYFVEQYNAFFQKNYSNLEIKYQTPYKNPPFNTKLKDKEKAHSNAQFLNWFFDDSD